MRRGSIRIGDHAERTVDEGKKIRWIDGVAALVTLLRWRVMPPRRFLRGPEASAAADESV